ncbi:MAG TPA: cellulose synthase subunit BcsC-related outer membrane protein, partial [Bryobacteraceae bacterium]
ALSFGTLAAGATFSPQHASGVAADAQISTASYGVRLGSSPDGFLTRDFVGGFRLNPRNGPITFLLERDSVRDTLLSYSGARDPVTHQIWGGVVSNTASLQGHWGTDRSGFYASTGYEFLSGRNVAANRAILGNIGNYEEVVRRGHGSLTLGTNFSAMHYDKNLRYFTLGQGGYFSPQQYFLFDVPFHWSGTYGRRLQYSAGGSLGVQRFQEDSSPFYPNSPRLQAQSGESYAALRCVGANFSLDGQALYQLAPQWIAGTFFSANNARNYASIAGGFFVKFTFEPKRLGLDHDVPGVPNWRGQQPLSEY